LLFPLLAAVSAALRAEVLRRREEFLHFFCARAKKSNEMRAYRADRAFSNTREARENGHSADKRARGRGRRRRRGPGGLRPFVRVCAEPPRYSAAGVILALGARERVRFFPPPPPLRARVSESLPRVPRSRATPAITKETHASGKGSERVCRTKEHLPPHSSFAPITTTTTRSASPKAAAPFEIHPLPFEIHAPVDVDLSIKDKAALPAAAAAVSRLSSLVLDHPRRISQAPTSNYMLMLAGFHHPALNFLRYLIRSALNGRQSTISVCGHRKKGRKHF